jgi:hypothetical protein
MFKKNKKDFQATMRVVQENIRQKKQIESEEWKPVHDKRFSEFYDVSTNDRIRTYHNPLYNGFGNRKIKKPKILECPAKGFGKRYVELKNGKEVKTYQISALKNIVFGKKNFPEDGNWKELKELPGYFVDEYLRMISFNKFEIPQFIKACLRNNRIFYCISRFDGEKSTKFRLSLHDIMKEYMESEVFVPSRIDEKCKECLKEDEGMCFEYYKIKNCIRNKYEKEDI